MNPLFQVLFASSIYYTSTWASYGDRTHIFQACLNDCQSTFCTSSSTWQPPSVALRLTGWKCLDDCKYTCMHIITEQAIQNNGEIYQYFGKWPFLRFAGMQEPASVAFSLLNLAFHARGAQRVRRAVPEDHPMRWYYLAFAIFNINAWIWSAVFHTRDLPTTEKLDYFSAAAGVIFALYYTVIRMFHLYTAKSRRYSVRWHPRIPKLRAIWGFMCAVAFVGHVSYLTLLPRFDYAYNMAFNLAIGTAHNLLWVLFAFPSSFPIIHRFISRPASYRPSYVYKGIIFVLLTTAATALELFDFPPWKLTVDAHALWHLSTAPIVAFWYEFLIEDALCDGWTRKKEE